MARKKRHTPAGKSPKPARRKLPHDPFLAKMDRIARADDRWRMSHGMKPFDPKKELA